MRLVTLFLIAAFAASTVGAASYQKTDGTIVDPMLDKYGEPHSYSGANLQPGADLSEAYLRYANLSGSDLSSLRNVWTINWTDAYYYTDNVPTWDSGMDQAWRDSEGILAIDPTSGDFNSDGVFDAADYTLWKDNGGDWKDYRTWKDHFGQSTASGSGADHVPEPTTLLLALLALVAAPLRVRCG